jgi:hypothetical protein
MSNDHYDYVMELIYQELDSEEKSGSLDGKIKETAKKHNLDTNDPEEHEEIIIKIAEERLRESFYE